MKKILLLIALSTPALLLGASFDNLAQLIDLVGGEKAHKNMMFDFKKAFKDKEFDLIKRQHDEKYDLRIKYLVKFKQKLELDGKFDSQWIDQWAADKKAEEVALCTKHLEEWKQLCDDHHMKVMQMYTEAKSKLNAISKPMYTMPTVFIEEFSQPDDSDLMMEMPLQVS